MVKGRYFVFCTKQTSLISRVRSGLLRLCRSHPPRSQPAGQFRTTQTANKDRPLHSVSRVRQHGIAVHTYSVHLSLPTRRGLLCPASTAAKYRVHLSQRQSVSLTGRNARLGNLVNIGHTTLTCVCAQKQVFAIPTDDAPFR